ncbi:undecaprenyl-diphosphate phosphatase [Agromyces tardus]|jgi:undecaprenyl-diphosphatase|uniref:Undecaprenyl-diphosphatase n=1 Tax=Agromyces tardus TaxID=2583849 RepID=A0A3M8A8Z5_9MICO|nr:undecaprenyl-diphosphate phosphatase [Agromyces tardus]RNB47582.1 undecaprenyl-diphosphate phosphatase [Agromyces tardus]
MLHVLEALILGLVQGLTEFLPISSSAHLRIVGEFLPGAQDPGAAFTAITQLGTETAVIVFFWRDIVRIVSHWFGSFTGRVPRNDPDARMGWLIIIGSLPIVVLGLVFQDQIETTFRSLYIVATMLIVFGIVLGLADWAGAKNRGLDRLTVPHGIYFGLAQSLALIPGVSRSGGTITMGLLLGYERAAAARYAFLLAIPAVFGSGLYQLFKSMGEPAVYGPLETAAATLVAFVVAILIIAFFMNWISKHSFLPFVIYRIALGTAIFIMLGAGVIQPY